MALAPVFGCGSRKCVIASSSLCLTATLHVRHLPDSLGIFTTRVQRSPRTTFRRYTADRIVTRSLYSLYNVPDVKTTSNNSNAISRLKGTLKKISKLDQTDFLTVLELIIAFCAPVNELFFFETFTKRPWCHRLIWSSTPNGGLYVAILAADFCDQQASEISENAMLYTYMIYHPFIYCQNFCNFHL